VPGSSQVWRSVLRKKPPGKLLASAHAVEREYRVLSALGGALDKNGRPIPVPKVICLCTDSSVIGTPFYVMEHLEGRVFFEVALASVSPADRAQIFDQMSGVLSAIHAVDPAAVGLGDYGKVENYCGRQVKLWKRQYDASAVGEACSPAMSELADWLQSHLPPQPRRGSVVHGDYRLDNLVFHPHEPRVIGVLDWELSTLGDPLADAAYSCLLFHMPPGHAVLQGLDPLALPPGIPSEAAYVNQYCERLGVDFPTATWPFYVALGLFRSAAIAAGVYKRAFQGNASSANAKTLGPIVGTLAQRALVVARGPPLVRPVSLPTGGGLLGLSRACVRLRDEVLQFLEHRILPAEPIFHAHARSDKRWTIHPLLEQLKAEAKAAGLWNFWIPADLRQHLLSLNEGFPAALLGHGLTNLEYAPICEVTGRSVFAPEVFNCSAPDTGNMEVLARYGSPAQRARWLRPLLEGEIRSCFAMTEPGVASSDATNIESRIEADGKGHYLLNGKKWWTSGAMDPRCKIAIFMGKTSLSAATHRQQSMILVPMETPGVEVIRPLGVFGYDDAPHGHAEVDFKDVRVTADNILLGEGRGFEIAQGRLGPGRLHHCMRVVGMAERAIELMRQRMASRKTFGKALAEHGVLIQNLAENRIHLEQARLMVLNAAHQLDTHGNKVARPAIAMAKVVAPRAALAVLDSAIQVHGGAGVSDDTVLAAFYAGARTLRLADGPDEVHLRDIGRIEMRGKARL